MAKQDKETYESYAKDMFDNPPAGPMGVHRGARSMASRALPYVIVVIVALLAGLLFWGVYSGENALVGQGGLFIVRLHGG